MTMDSHTAPPRASLPPEGAAAAEPGPAPGRSPSQQAIPLIQLRGITKVYGTGSTAFQALKGVDLDIDPGDFVAIMGPSGSGKSTAMNILGCLDTPSAGRYFFRGVRGVKCQKS